MQADYCFDIGLETGIALQPALQTE